MDFKPSDEQQAVYDQILTLPAGECLYVDGEAGTGKSWIIEQACEKLGNVLKCAPSGIAATNIGGRTFHKTLQLNGDFYFDRNSMAVRRKNLIAEFSINMSDDKDRKRLNGMVMMRLCTHRMDILRNANAIWVDEAPMVRCDLIDEMDIRLRHIMKKPHTPFGGKRIIFSGDLGQLQPVVSTTLKDWEDPEVDKTDEEQLLNAGYVAPFGFQQARAFQNDTEDFTLDKVV